MKLVAHIFVQSVYTALAAPLVKNLKFIVGWWSGEF